MKKTIKIDGKTIQVMNSNPNSKFEIPSLLSRIWQFPIKVILSVLPTFLARRIFLACSDEKSDTKIVHLHTGTHIALEVMYTYPDRKKKKQTTRLDDFWENFLLNAMAVRNRLVLVEKILLELIRKLNCPEVVLASVGCGSARSVIEAVTSLNGKVAVNLIFVDPSKDALAYSKKLAESHGLDNNVRYIRGMASNLPNEPMVDIIEMVGLLDYFLNPAAIKLLKTVRRALKPGGYLVTCNIIPNLEQPFVRKGINWEMTYRSPEQLTQILHESGFSPENINLIVEPLQIHCLAICRKSDDTPPSEEKISIEEGEVV